ncbi:EID1-like F-box protein 3 [Papaver somniferum]|uniref:EID1-like F-box protein 3 n=1 Tax=Papaver somniferum TaxID=3469 RepID=UPI000E704A83|nr:EID1-like F-box protein 3 [Papaver somniferum]
MNQRLKSIDLSTTSGDTSSGILDEKVLYLVSQSINWDPHILCLMSCVCRKVSAVAKRVLWKELCISRAPRMVEGMAPANGGWDSLAKILFYCCGGKPSPNFQAEQVLKGHFAIASRFSKTSGQSFLIKKCQTDVLYICDPCEHSTGNISAAGGSGGVDGGAGNDDDLGVFRGVFKGFVKSKTRECLIKRQIQFEDHIRCPYCKSRVWSMTLAKLVPTKSALRKLGSVDGSRLEYFVCVHGHLHGTCWLTRLSSDDEDDGLVGSSSTGKTSSSGEEICETVIYL